MEKNNLKINVENVGEYITNKISKKFGCKRNAGYAFSDLINTKKETAYNIVKDYSKGDITPKERNFVHNGGFGQLERLSFFYQLIDIDENDDLIRYTKEKNFGFEYPPIIKTQKDCLVNVNFLDEKYSLTSEQQNSLENIALLYAKSNVKK